MSVRRGPRRESFKSTVRQCSLCLLCFGLSSLKIVHCIPIEGGARERNVFWMLVRYSKNTKRNMLGSMLESMLVQVSSCKLTHRALRHSAGSRCFYVWAVGGRFWREFGSDQAYKILSQLHGNFRRMASISPPAASATTGWDLAAWSMVEMLRRHITSNDSQISTFDGVLTSLGSLSQKSEIPGSFPLKSEECDAI